MPALAFYLDAPMQSWGASSKYQYRETETFPTKSAILGLLAAALGIDKHSPDEAEKLAPLNQLHFTAVRLPKSVNGRPLNSTRLTDFHTIGGGYDKYASLREKMSISPTGDRKWKTPDKQTVVTRRTYLTETSFIAILEGNEATLKLLADALLNPVWGIWFGRKTCLPATPLTPTLGADKEKAFTTLLQSLPHLEPAPLNTFEYQQEIIGETQDGDFYQSDTPIAFGQHHGPVPTAYRSRAIRHYRPESP